MLIRKMLREIGRNFGQFFSIFVLSFLALSLFATMKASNISAYNKLEEMRDITSCGDGWVFGEGFDEEDLEKVKALPEIKDAQRKMHITATAAKHDQAQLEVFLLEDNRLSKPYYVSGKEFDVKDTDGLWLCESFAKEWDLKEGDKFSFVYNGVTVEKTIRGLIVSPEYQYLKADKDLDVVNKNISVVYMAYEGFPCKDFIKSLISKGDITLDDAIEKSDEIRDKVEAMEQLGMDRSSITKDKLIEAVDKLDDEKIFEIMPYTELVFTTDEEDVKALEPKISDALDGDYAVFCDRDDMPGIKVMKDELAQHDQFAITFPVIFIAIALLVIMTTMNRMIAKQRTQIGTMRAIGIKRRSIILHYLSYSFIVSFIGSLAGLLVGTYVFGEGLAKVFRQWYFIPGWTVETDMTMVLVLVLTVFCCCLATYFSCRKVMNIHPAASLRPAAPKSGKKTVFEKLSFWNKLGFSAQYNLRDISRGKLRAFMGVFGTAAGMMIMVCALASITTITQVSEWTFDKLQNFKLEIDFDSDITPELAEEYKDRFGGELLQGSAIEISKDKKALADEKKRTTLMVIEGLGYYGLTDTDLNSVELKKGEAAITMKLAESMDIKVGDKIYWHMIDKNTWYEATVGIINRNPTFTGITMLRSDYEESGANYSPNVLYTNSDVKKADIKDLDGILAVHDDKDLKESVDIMLEMIYVMIGIFVAFAAILPIVVLYNSGNLSFNERVKEFATLKVLGFTTKRIRDMLSEQNMWLSVIGVIVGAPFGTRILQYMFDSNGDSMDFPVGADFLSYIASGAFILVISVLVAFMFNKRIKKLDMVEILKGMD